METIIPFWLKKLLNEEGAEQVAQSVRNAELKTAAEIVPLVVSKSSHSYPEFKYGYIFCALAAFLTVNPLFLLVIYGLHRLNKKIQRDYCEARAVAEFSKLGLGQTTGQTGVLIMVSVQERQVVILADKGIHDLIPTKTLDHMIAQLIPQIKAGALAAGLEATINHLGTVCGEILPRHRHDQNELSDQLVIKE